MIDLAFKKSKQYSKPYMHDKKMLSMGEEIDIEDRSNTRKVLQKVQFDFHSELFDF